MAQAYSKEMQLYNKRQTLTAKQRGAISDKVYNEALERSNGFCEKCGREDHLQGAHLIRRWQLSRTTSKDIAMLCLSCHTYCDSCRKGREWMEEYREKLYESAHY